MTIEFIVRMVHIPYLQPLPKKEAVCHKDISPILKQILESKSKKKIRY
ncbi:hypothetical protein [Poseidonibacter ostreae]|nr:hypothetical protein [Poseidonibacter ostreae]